MNLTTLSPHLLLLLTLLITSTTSTLILDTTNQRIDDITTLPKTSEPNLLTSFPLPPSNPNLKLNKRFRIGSSSSSSSSSSTKPDYPTAIENGLKIYAEEEGKKSSAVRNRNGLVLKGGWWGFGVGFVGVVAGAGGLI